MVLLNKSPIFIAPLAEAIYMQQHGKTRSYSNSTETTLLEVTFPSKAAEPALQLAIISQSLGKSWVLYSNELFSMSFEIANRRVVY